MRCITKFKTRYFGGVIVHHTPSLYWDDTSYLRVSVGESTHSLEVSSDRKRLYVDPVELQGLIHEIQLSYPPSHRLAGGISTAIQFLSKLGGL